MRIPIILVLILMMFIQTQNIKSLKQKVRDTKKVLSVKTARESAAEKATQKKVEDINRR